MARTLRSFPMPAASVIVYAIQLCNCAGFSGVWDAQLGAKLEQNIISLVVSVVIVVFIYCAPAALYHKKVENLCPEDRLLLISSDLCVRFCKYIC